MLFLFSARHRYLLPLPVFGLLGFLGLPFTPAWGGMQLYTSRTVLYVLPLFVLAHALLGVGYVHHAVRSEPLPGQSQRWVGLLYPLGLALFPVIQFTWLWQAMHWPSVLRLSIASPDTTHLPLLTWMGGALALGLAVLFLWISHRRHPNPPRWLSSIGPQILSLRWFYNFLGIAFHISIRLVGFLTGLLEGDGGILWVLVLLALLVVLLLHGGRM
jgi:hypothetical protein